MLIARYWSKAEADAENRRGKPMRVRCWRGSATSESEAQSLASRLTSHGDEGISTSRRT